MLEEEGGTVVNYIDYKKQTKNIELKAEVRKVKANS